MPGPLIRVFPTSFIDGLGTAITALKSKTTGNIDKSPLRERTSTKLESPSPLNFMSFLRPHSGHRRRAVSVRSGKKQSLHTLPVLVAERSHLFTIIHITHTREPSNAYYAYLFSPHDLGRPYIEALLLHNLRTRKSTSLTCLVLTLPRHKAVYLAQAGTTSHLLPLPAGDRSGVG